MNLNLKQFQSEEITKVFSRFWAKYHSAAFFVYFVALVSLGGYIWYVSVYASDWPREKKQQYMKEKDQSVVLNEKDLKATLDVIDQRQKEFDAQSQSVRNIFSQYKK